MEMGETMWGVDGDKRNKECTLGAPEVSEGRQRCKNEQMTSQSSPEKSSGRNSLRKLSEMLNVTDGAVKLDI